MSDVPTQTPAVATGGASLVPGFVSADLSQRLLGRAVDAAVAILLMYVVPLASLLFPSVEAIVISYLAITLTLCAVMLALPFVLSSLVGYALLGLRFVDVHTGQPCGGKVVGKYLLEGLLPFVGMIIAAVTLDQHQRTWYDRFVGVQLVRWRDRDRTVPDGVEADDLQDRRPLKLTVDAGRDAPIVDLLDPATLTVPAVPAPDLAPTTPAVPLAAAPPRASVMLDNGEMVRLDTPVLLGRDPGSIPAVPNGRPHQVRDTERSLSKTHLAVGSDEAGVWVMDCHSTNGSRLDSAGASVPLAPWSRVPVHVGDVVRYGDRSLTITSGTQP